MRTATWKYSARAAAGAFWALGLLLAFAGCQKKCQQPPGAAFTSITEAEWRLVETDDPSVGSTLTKFTFLIWKFDATKTGTIINVVNNLKYNNPVLTMNYEIDVDAEEITIQFVAPPPPSNDPNAPPQQGTVQGQTTYQYSLKRDLVLYDVNNGYTYRFVQFQGIVNPDNNCAF